MAVSKSAIKAVDSAIRKTSLGIGAHVEHLAEKGAFDRLYELRRTLMVLAKVRCAFEPELVEPASATSEPLGFQTDSESDQGEETELDIDVPEARSIGFRPKA